MKSRLLHQLNMYKELMINENDERILIEMIIDFKNTLIKNSNDIDLNYYILETFYNIESKSDLFDRLDNLENILLEEGGLSIPNIKKAFMSKHDKIIERDKKWLSANKKKILGMNYEGVEIEVLSDYKVTFEQLLNRHNIFDKLFVNSKDSENIGENLRRFEDKNENLKNGLDNYFRTGTSRREVGLRKLSGEDAKVAIENMVVYCESFLSGKKYIEEKMNNIIVAVSDESVKESLSPINKLKILLEGDLSDITKASKELSQTSKTNSPKNTKDIDDKNVDKGESSEKDVLKASKEIEQSNKNKTTKNEENTEEDISQTSEELDDIDGSEEGDIDENVDEETPEDELGEEENTEGEDTQPTTERGINDRQIGVAVLLTVAEERYFDYINLLKGLIEE